MSGPQDTLPGTNEVEEAPRGKRERLPYGTYQLIPEARDEIDTREERPLAPVGKLPGEVLGHIFEYYVDSGGSPWRLAQICEAWSRTALNTPYLWTRLLFPKTGKPAAPLNYEIYAVNGKQQFSLYNWQVCLDAEALDAALQRSGAGLPLTLRFEGKEEYQHPHTRKAFVKLMSSPSSERVGSLELGDFSLDDEQFAAEVSIALGTFPSLREIKMMYTEAWTYNLLKAVESTSTSLVAMEYYSWKVTNEMASYSFWARLKKLKLANQHDDGRGLNLITQKPCGLEQFHLTHLLNWPNATTPISTWENIREITLWCHPIHLSRLQLPRLENFVCLASAWLDRVTGDRSLCNYGQISYPALHTLYLNIEDRHWHEYTAGAFPAVVNFTFRGDCKFGTSALLSVPNARNVNLVSTAAEQDGIMQFLLDLQSSEEPLLCPNQETLRLGTDAHPLVLKGECEPLVKELVKFREEVGKPLRELIVHWKDDGEVADYAASAV